MYHTPTNSYLKDYYATVYSAEIVNTFTLTESLVSGHALVRYDIANSPVKELRVAVPAGFKNVEISGAKPPNRTTAKP